MWLNTHKWHMYRAGYHLKVFDTGAYSILKFWRKKYQNGIFKVPYFAENNLFLFFTQPVWFLTAKIRQYLTDSVMSVLWEYHGWIPSPTYSTHYNLSFKRNQNHNINIKWLFKCSVRQPQKGKIVLIFFILNELSISINVVKKATLSLQNKSYTDLSLVMRRVTHCRWQSSSTLISVNVKDRL